MSDRSMLITILTLAWPTMLEQLMQTAVQYIDTAMVGSLGTQATAAVGSTGTVNWLIGSTISAVGVGFLSYIAKAFGADDQAAAKRAVAQAVLFTGVLGIFFTVLTVSLSGMIPVWMRVDTGIREMASTYFLIFISAHAAQDGEHYFRHGAPFGGRYEITDENRTAGELCQCGAELFYDLSHPSGRDIFPAFYRMGRGTRSSRRRGCQRHRLYDRRNLHYLRALGTQNDFSQRTEIFS